MNKNYEQLINTQLFEISSPEVYNKCIPKYYTQENRGDPPRVNGRRVTWEEYHALYPDSEFVEDEAFTPAMVYEPEDMNEATSKETVAAMIDLIECDISFSIYDPETNYPIILDILQGYKDTMNAYSTTRADILKYLEKVDKAIGVVGTHYELWKARKYYKQHGRRDDHLTEFDRIERRFQ